MVISIEQHVDWIATLLAHGYQRIEATPQAEAGWVAHVNAVADATPVAPANSWYMGANVPGKPRVFMPYLGGVGAYAGRAAAKPVTWGAGGSAPPTYTI